MTNTYIKPETKTIKVELQQMVAVSTPINDTDATKTGTEYNDARGFGFDFFMEEEEVPGKSDDEDWEDWEDEDDP